MARTARPDAGVIGLGIIGSRAAANLRRAGYQVWLWNRSPRTEPNFLSSPGEVAEAAKIIQIFVSDGPALLQTIRDMEPSLGPEHVIINHATVSPRETQEASRMVADQKAKFLDCPFTGSRAAAEAGQLVFLVGGDEVTLAKVKPQLEVNSKEIIRVGHVGQATVVKVVTNLMAAVAVESISEALALLSKNHIPLVKLQEVLAFHGVRSPLVDMKLPGMIAGSFDTHFSLQNMLKDVRIALSMADEAGIELPAAEAFAKIAKEGVDQGWSQKDFSVIARHFGGPLTDSPSRSSSHVPDSQIHDLEPFVPKD